MLEQALREIREAQARPVAAPFGPSWERKEAALLEVRDLYKFFPVRRGIFSRIHGFTKAVRGVSFTLKAGETLGLVGESGSGKTTVARTVLRLQDPTAGKIVFDGEPLHALRGRKLKKLRPRIQIIFQDPYLSLNPRRTVATIVGEALVEHGRVKRRERDERVRRVLERVGLSGDHMNRYPHEFSGGQRQRISIARALALEPDLIVCDEPVSALDVSIQAQVINLLMRLQEELGLAYLFIAHDLSVVRHVSDRVAVMYAGELVEHADRARLFEDPRHPYTRCLLSAVPKLDPSAPRTKIRVRAAPAEVDGEAPEKRPEGEGCPFHPRCPDASEVCRRRPPPVRDHGSGHWSVCHLLSD